MVRPRLLLLRWAIDESEALWSSHRFGMWLVFAGMAVSAALLYWPPAPGIAVAVMGITAALMTARKEPTAWEKAAWTFMMFALLLVEVLAIRKDRKENNSKMEALFQQGVGIKGQAETKFNEIGTRIEKQITASGIQFQQTMDKENSVLDETKSTASLSQQNLAIVTGKDSYPCIVPQSHAVSKNGVLPLVVWDKGTNVLTGVQVRLMSEAEYLSDAIFYKPPAELGTLRPEWPKPLPDGVTPMPDRVWSGPLLS